MSSFKKYLAEFIGTMVLVTIACGVAVVTGCTTPADKLMTALAFGGVIVAMAYSVGNVSGCHINPAVSLAMLVSKKMSFKDFIGYIIAQVLGAIAGAAILGVIFGFTNPDNSFGCNGLVAANTTDAAIIKSLIIEAVLTAVFVFAILGVTSKKEYGRVAGLVIGGSLTLVHLLGIPLTGTSVNPARSFGPALISMLAGNNAEPWNCIWVFVVGPFVGALLAALAWRMISGKCCEEEE